MCNRELGALSPVSCLRRTINLETARHFIQNGLVSERLILTLKLLMLQHATMFHLISTTLSKCTSAWAAVGLTKLNAVLKNKGQFSALIDVMRDRVPAQ